MIIRLLRTLMWTSHEGMQKLTMKLSQSVTFIADNIFCSPMIITLSSIVLSVGILPSKCYGNHIMNSFEKQIYWDQHFSESVSKRNDSVTILKTPICFWGRWGFKNLICGRETAWFSSVTKRCGSRNFDLCDLGIISTEQDWMRIPAAKRILHAVESTMKIWVFAWFWFLVKLSEMKKIMTFMECMAEGQVKSLFYDLFYIYLHQCFVRSCCFMGKIIFSFTALTRITRSVMYNNLI